MNDYLNTKNKQDQDLQRQIDQAAAKIRACNIISGFGLALFIVMFITLMTSFDTDLILNDFSYVGNYMFYATMAVVILVLIVFFRTGKYRGQLISLISNQVVFHIVNEYVELKKYNKYQAVSIDIIRNLKVINGWTSHRGSDYIDALHKGQSFKYSNLHLYWVERVSSGGESGDHERIHTVFNGQWLICDLPEICPTRLIIKEHTPGSGAENGNFSTNNDAFNQRFILLSEDAEAALTMLTPDLIQRIENLANSFKGRLFLIFDKKTLHIGLQTHHSFFEVKPKEVRQKSLEEIRDKIRGEVGYICKIIEIIFDK